MGGQLHLGIKLKTLLMVVVDYLLHSFVKVRLDCERTVFDICVDVNVVSLLVRRRRDRFPYDFVMRIVFLDVVDVQVGVVFVDTVDGGYVVDIKKIHSFLKKGVLGVVAVENGLLFLVPFGF
jgi:hypothetical protein